ncbi:unnamed protein product [Gadus morhua 'NCC']
MLRHCIQNDCKKLYNDRKSLFIERSLSPESVKMIWVLVCALVTLSVADELDILYPDLEHSRTIYVTG